MKFIYSPLWEKANFWSRSLSVSWLETGETIAFEFLYLTYHPIDFDWPPSEASSSELVPSWFPLNSSLSPWLSWLSLSVSFEDKTWLKFVDLLAKVGFLSALLFCYEFMLVIKESLSCCTFLLQFSLSFSWLTSSSMYLTVLLCWVDTSSISIWSPSWPSASTCLIKLNFLLWCSKTPG